MCRYCHDEHETHYFNRKTVTQLICTECDTRQKVQAECEKCGVRFGKVSGVGVENKGCFCFGFQWGVKYLFNMKIVIIE